MGLDNAKVKNAMDYWNPTTRDFAIKSINPGNQGYFSIQQICDIWDVVTYNWVYVSDPQGEAGLPFTFTPASETIKARLRGDCDDYATLLAAALEAIGGEPHLIVAENANSAHAYTQVYVGQSGVSGAQPLTNYICERYGAEKVWYSVYEDGSTWLNLDWWGNHPGSKFYPQQTKVDGIFTPWNDGRLHPMTETEAQKSAGGIGIETSQHEQNNPNF